MPPQTDDRLSGIKSEMSWIEIIHTSRGWHYALLDLTSNCTERMKKLLLRLTDHDRNRTWSIWIVITIVGSYVNWPVSKLIVVIRHPVTGRNRIVVSLISTLSFGHDVNLRLEGRERVLSLPILV